MKIWEHDPRRPTGKGPKGVELSLEYSFLSQFALSILKKSFLCTPLYETDSEIEIEKKINNIRKRKYFR